MPAPDDKNHKWVRKDAREAIEALAVHMGTFQFKATRKPPRISYAKAEYSLAVLCGLLPWPTTSADVALVSYALGVLDDAAPGVAPKLRQYARERAAIAGAA